MSNFHSKPFSFSSRGLKGLIERRLGIDLLFEQQLVSEIRGLAAREATRALTDRTADAEATLAGRLDDVARKADAGIARVESDIARVESDVSRHRKNIAELDKTLRGALEGMNRQRDTAAALASQVNGRFTETNEAVRSLARRSNEAEDVLRKRLDEVIRTARQTDARITRVSADLSRQSNSVTELEQALQAGLRTCVDRFQRLEAQGAALRNDLGDMARRLDAATQATEALAGQVKRRIDAAEVATRNLAGRTLQADAATGKRLDEIAGMIQQAGAEITAFAGQFRELETAGATLRDDLRDITQRIDEVANTSKAFAVNLNATEAVTRTLAASIAETEAAFGNRLDDVTQAARLANAEIARMGSDLRRQGENITELEQGLRDEVNAFAGRFQQLESRGSTLRDDLERMTRRITDVTNTSEALNASINAAETATRELAASVTETEAGLGSRLDDVSRMAQHAEGEIARMGPLLSRQDENFTKLERDLRDDINAFVLRFEQFETEGTTLRGELESMAQRVDDAARMTQQTDAEIVRLDSTLSRQGDGIAALEQGLRDEMNAFVGRFQQFETEGTALRGELESMAQRVDDVAGASEALSGQIGASEEETRALISRASEAEAALVNRLTEISQRTQHVDAQITRIDTTIAQQRGRIDRAMGIGQMSRYMHPSQNQKPHFFLVTTLGYSASRWLAKTLNQIDRVTCTHGRNKAELGLVYDRDFRVKEWKEVWQDMPSRGALSLNAFFEELQSVGSADVYGNVHHYGIAELSQKLEHEHCEFEFKCCDLIRHPISVIESRYQAHLDTGNPNNRFEKDLGTFHDSMPQYIEDMQLGDLVDRHKLDTSDKGVSMFFRALEGARWMTSAVETYPAHKYIPMEEVVASPETFRAVAEYLLGPDIEISKKHIEEKFSRDRLNQHRTHRKRGGPAGDFKSWKAWQKDAARHYFERERTAVLFGSFGYDFSFMN